MNQKEFIHKRLNCNSNYVLKGKYTDGTDVYYLKNDKGDWTTHIEDAFQSTSKETLSKYIDVFKSSRKDPSKFEVEIIEEPSRIGSYSSDGSNNLEDFKVKVNNRLYDWYERRDLSTTAVERLMELYDKDIDMTSHFQGWQVTLVNLFQDVTKGVFWT